MVDSSRIEQVLAALTPCPWSGSVFRVMLAGNPPERENQVGARWNPPDLAAIYTSLQAQTAIAEVEYHLSQQPRPVRPDLRKTLYEIRAELSAVTNIVEVLDDLIGAGVSRDELFADDWRISQDVGRLSAWFESDGILVPSARASGLNLVIYPSRVNFETYRFEIIRSESL